jgi:hypothetical protein
MMGFSLNPIPPMAAKTVAGKSGRFLQVVVDDSRLMTSQVSVATLPAITPPQTSSLEKPRTKRKLLLSLVILTCNFLA